MNIKRELANIGKGIRTEVKTEIANQGKRFDAIEAKLGIIADAIGDTIESIGETAGEVVGEVVQTGKDVGSEIKEGATNIKEILDGEEKTSKKSTKK